ncbi:MAG TPA: response regulator, partial [Rhodocyclaceae bacterium]|nr:response regulator [Rhodocyclaceae bacterium]
AVTVRDTGIGIPAEKLDMVFERFTQADASTTRRYGGAGLGLAISARLATLMGGRIEVDSGQERGSEFCLSLTLGLSEQRAVSPPAEQLGDLRLLIVDDHPLAREILGRTCAACGWQATAVGSGAAGLAELRQSAAAGRDYDLMLLDWRMPELDGIAMLRQAYATPGIGLPLVVLMAATPELEQAVAASDDLHLDGIVAKPVTPATLFDAVRRAYSGERVELPADGTEPPRRLAGKRLLVAEDNELNQQVIEQILSRAGAEVVIVANGLAAVEALRPPTAHFDAVLMDIQMPIMDGYAATRVIRDELGRSGLPIIAVTAYAQSEDREKSRAAGMSGHIVKPIDVDSLLDILDRDRPREASPPVAAAAAGGGMIDLPGLDPGALQVFGGDHKFYGGLLQQFATRHGGDIAEARRRFDAGDSAGAARLVHEIRGVTAFLRATEVPRLATETERALSAGDGEAIHRGFAELQAAMAVLIGSIQEFLALAPAA